MATELDMALYRNLTHKDPFIGWVYNSGEVKKPGIHVEQLGLDDIKQAAQVAITGIYNGIVNGSSPPVDLSYSLTENELLAKASAAVNQRQVPTDLPSDLIYILRKAEPIRRMLDANWRIHDDLTSYPPEPESLMRYKTIEAALQLAIEERINIYKKTIKEDGPNKAYFLSRFYDMPAGIGGLNVRPDKTEPLLNTAVLFDTATLPRFQRKGIWKALIRERINYAKSFLASRGQELHNITVGRYNLSEAYNPLFSDLYELAVNNDPNSASRTPFNWLGYQGFFYSFEMKLFEDFFN